MSVDETRRIRIALLEDSLPLLDALSRVIRAEPDFDLILAASSAEEALAFDGWETLQVAIVDLRLPGMSGLELIARLRDQHPALGIIVCTVHEDREHVLASMKAGASAYLLKRELESGSAICTVIRQVMKGDAPLSPTAAKWMLQEFRHPHPVEHERLSAREVEVLQFLAQGHIYKHIAEHMNLSAHTIHAHVRNIHAKLQVGGRKEAIYRARLLGYDVDRPSQES